MRKAVMVAVMVFGLSGTAHAGMGDWFRNTWEYATSPVNCVSELGKDLIAASSKFVACFLSNANRNPATLTTLIR